MQTPRLREANGLCQGHTQGTLESLGLIPVSLDSAHSLINTLYSVWGLQAAWELGPPSGHPAGEGGGFQARAGLPAGD